jgi:hypothetical protein
MFTRSDTAGETPTQPLASVTDTVYAPPIDVEIDALLLLLLHEYDTYPGDAVSVVTSPSHIERSPDMIGAGKGLTVIVAFPERLPGQFASETDTSE